MAYVVTAASFNPKTRTSHFSSTAGSFQGQVAHLASENKSSLLRGYLLAALNGLMKIQNLYGMGKGEIVELLIPDEQIAEQFRNPGAQVFSKLLHSDNEDLWAQIASRKKDFDIRVMSHPDEGEELAKIWLWQHPEHL
jgi:hypothetical protein